MHRRRILSSCIAPAAILLIAQAAVAADASANGWLITVRETAGIRRFGYPVTAVLPGAPAAGHAVLLDHGKPVAAQFSPQTDDQGKTTVAVDFAVSMGPYQTRSFAVKTGAGRVVSERGLTIAATDGSYRVRHPGQLEFVVPGNLLGLLAAVNDGKTAYLRPGSPGLWILYKDNIRYRAGGPGPFGKPTSARITKKGPLAVAIRFQGTEALRGERSVASTVAMDFVLSKSWVRVHWSVADPEGCVAGLGAELSLDLARPPILVDLGAGSLVYTHLLQGQAAALRTGSGTIPWETWVGWSGKLHPYVLAARGASASKAEGWAHVMDAQRCTAVAMAGFADAGKKNTLEVDANGRLRLWRRDAELRRGIKDLTFWLHFVGMPVQVGAVTSPQAMLAPLETEVSAAP